MRNKLINKTKIKHSNTCSDRVRIKVPWKQKVKKEIYLAQGSVKASRRRWNLQLSLEKNVWIPLGSEVASRIPHWKTLDKSKETETSQYSGDTPRSEKNVNTGRWWEIKPERKVRSRHPCILNVCYRVWLLQNGKQRPFGGEQGELDKKYLTIWKYSYNYIKSWKIKTQSKKGGYQNSPGSNKNITEKDIIL